MPTPVPDPIELPEPDLIANASAWNDRAGRIMSVASDAERDATCPNPTRGQMCFNASGLEVYSPDDDAWLGITSAATAASLQAQIDAIPGLAVLKKVRVATVAAGTLASSFENGDTVDGVVLATGDRILLKDQAAGEANGIYVVAASGAPTRAADADSAAELINAIVVVSEGTANADKLFICTNNSITLETTPLTFIVLPDITAAITAAEAYADAAAAAAVVTASENHFIPRLLGITALVAGTVDVTDHDAAVGDIIIVTVKRALGVPGPISEVLIDPSNKFTITSTNVADASELFYAVWTP
jgi:hypothetical protein